MHAQRLALAEIYADMAAPNRMLRLLQGDVGSGKTVVALLAMLAAVDKPAAALPWLYRGSGADCVRSAAPMMAPFVRALLDGSMAVVLGAHALGTAVGLLF